MIDLEELIKRPEYKWLDDYKDRICFLTVSGSWGYGTNVEGSDIDLRGVILPTKEELIGLNHFEQKLDSDTDSCLYEVNKFIHLAQQINPNVVELLGCRDYLIFNDIGFQLLNNAKLFLNQRCIKTFKGYATAQLRRIEAALCHDSYSEEEQLKHIKDTMDVAMLKLEEKNEIFGENSVSSKIEDGQLKLTFNIDNKPINVIRSAMNDILTIEHTYDKLNARNTKKDEQHLNKHIMHLVRLFLTCIDILEKEEIITYREKDRDFLLEIRNGKYIKDGKLTPEFKDLLNDLEARLEKAKQNTKLPEKSNFNQLNKLVMDINESIIKGTVKQFKEPLKQLQIF